MKPELGLKKRAYEITSITAAIIIWEVIARFIDRTYILPSFTSVASTFIDLVQKGGELHLDILTSLNHFLIGIGMAVAIGIPIGVIMGWFKTADRLVDPLIEMIRPIPPLAWIPFAIMWFKLTPYAAGFVIFIGAVFPIVVNTYTGFKNIPRVLVESAKVLGCIRNRDVILRIAFPSALPSIASGIRVGMGVGWMCVVAAEFFAVSEFGIGRKIWIWNDLHHMDTVLTYMLVLGIVAFSIDRVFRYVVQEWWLKWQVGLTV